MWANSPISLLRKGAGEKRRGEKSAKLIIIKWNNKMPNIQ